jgi:pimeloyl-ACP methyl ester carboxylesterase
MLQKDLTTERQFITTSDAVRIAFYVDDFTDPWKQSQTVFITHPAMSSARRLYAFVPRLARHYRVVRMDMRGHGGSQVPPAHLPLTRERLMQDLVELQTHLGVERAHFLGAAGGGYLAQWIAIAKPERVLSILLFASKPGLKHSQAASWIPQIESKGMRAFLMETIGDRFPPDYADSAHIAWFVDEIMRNDIEFIKRFILTMAGLYWMDEVAAIKCPALIVAPGEEPIGDGAAYQEMHQRIATSELLVYEGGRHNIGDYLADRCAADALSFLQRHFP